MQRRAVRRIKEKGRKSRGREKAVEH